MSRPSDHPPTCQVCRGTGWEPGPDIDEHANGRAIAYETVQPCAHHWRDDEPHRAELISRREYLDRLTARDDPAVAAWHDLEQRWRAG
jgi:hypothetical protein